MALALEGTAGLCARKAPALALILAGAADALRERTHQPLTPAERAAQDQALAAARDALDAAQVRWAWETGRGAGIEEAITMALEALARPRGE